MVIIGGADGPTSIHIASGMGWLNWFGLIIMVLLMLPNIVWAFRRRNEENRCTNRIINLLEQIGRYGCMLLMVFNIGVAELGFASPESFAVYLGGNAVLLLLSWIFWIVLYKKSGAFPALMLAVLPALIFLLCGVTLRHWLLAGFGVLFGFAHSYVTVVNTKGNARI